MNPVVFHIASGDSFFSGVAVLLASFALAQSSRRVLNRLTTVTFDEFSDWQQNGTTSV